MKLLTWVFCEDCFRKDEKRHDIPNFQTDEVVIKKAGLNFDSVEVTFDCLNCKFAILNKIRPLFRIRII